MTTSKRTIKLFNHNNYNDMLYMFDNEIGLNFLRCVCDYNDTDNMESKLKWYRKWFMLSDIVELYYHNINDPNKFDIHSMLKNYDNIMTSLKSSGDGDTSELEKHIDNIALMILQIIKKYYLTDSIFDTIVCTYTNDERKDVKVSSRRSRLLSKFVK